MEDDEMADVLLSSETVAIDPKQISKSLRRSCVSGALVPVLCGSALRGVAVEPLMDAAINYIPAANVLSSKVYVRLFVNRQVRANFLQTKDGTRAVWLCLQTSI